MKSKSDPSSPSAADLLDQLNTLVAEAEKLAADTVSEPAAEVIEALRVRFAAAQKNFGKLYAATKDQVVAGAHTTDDAIRSHPYESLAIGAGVGLLVGLLLSRGGRHC